MINWKSIGYKIALLILCISGRVLAQTAAEEANEQLSDSLAVKDSLFDSLKVDADSTRFVVYDSLFYNADSISYDVKNQTITLLGKAKITYEKSTIEADTIAIAQKEKRAYGSGHISMKDGSQDLLGYRLAFNFDTQQGKIVRGASKFDKGYYYGASIRKVDEDVYDISDGVFTTCDAEEPHFWIQSNKMRIYKDNIVVGKPFVFYVNHFPVFYFPFGAFPIRRGREAGFLVPTPGYSNSEGKYLKNIAYYYPYKDYADFLISADVTEKKGWETRLDSWYTERYKLNGDLSTRFLRRNINPEDYNTEWSLRYRHHQDFYDKSTFDINLHFISNKSVYSSDENLDDRTNQNISSSFAYKTFLWDRQLVINGNYNENLITKKKQLDIPSVSYYLPSRPITELAGFGVFNETLKKLSYSYGFKASHYGSITEKHPNFADLFYDTTKDSTGKFINEHHSGVKQSVNAFYSGKVAFLNLSQSFSYNEVWFDATKTEDHVDRAYDWSTSSSARFSLYGLRTFENYKLKAARHIITPYASFSYTPDLYTLNKNYYSFNGIGVSASREAKVLNFGVDNTWQLKFRGEKDDYKLNDFITTSSTSSLNYNKKGKRFNNINHRLNLNPGEFKLDKTALRWTNSGAIVQDFYNLEILTWSVSSDINISGNMQTIDYFPVKHNQFKSNEMFAQDTLKTKIDPHKLTESGNWTFGLNFDYSKNEKTNYKSTSLKPSCSLNLSKNWKLSYEGYYDLEKKDLISQSITASRDLHCWRLDFRYYRSGEYWDFKIVFLNIKLPDALKFDHRDHKYFQ